MESNDVQVNTSQTIADWKAQNSQRLGEIKSFNPDLFTAINGALSYLNKKYGGEEIGEETIVEPIIAKEEFEGETPYQRYDRILKFSEEYISIDFGKLTNALISKRKSKEQKLLILEAFGDFYEVDLEGMYGDVFRDAYLQAFTPAINPFNDGRKYIRVYRPKQWLKEWDDNIELSLTQFTDLDKISWANNFIFPHFESQINIKDIRNVNDLVNFWYQKEIEKPTIEIPTQTLTTPTQTFEENDKFITTGQNGKYSVEENSKRLIFNGVALNNVFNVGENTNRAEYYDFRLKVFQVVNVDDILSKKKMDINSRFNFLQDVYDTRDNSLGWINATTWDELNQQYVYLVKIQGDLKFIEEKYLSATPATLSTPITQTTFRFNQGDFLVNNTGEIDFDENGDKLEFKRSFLQNVIRVQQDLKKGSYYNFELQTNVHFNNVNTNEFEKLTSNPLFEKSSKVFYMPYYSEGIVVAITWDKLNNQFVYVIEFDGIQEFVEEAYLSATPLTQSTPLTQTTTSTESSEDDEDLGNLLEDLDNFEI
jgi:hypothetical protein